MSESAPDLAAEGAFSRAISRLEADRGGEDIFYCPRSIAGRPLAVVAGSVTSHTMNCPELTIALEGTTCIATPIRVFSLAPGQLLFVEPGVEHGGFPEDQPGRCQFLVCHFFSTVAHLNLYRTDDQLALRLVGRTNLQTIADAIGRELASRDSAWEVAVGLLLKYLVCVLERRLRQGRYLLIGDRPMAGLSATEDAWDLIERVLQYCSAHFHRPLRLAEVASQVGYSPGHLDRLFSKHTGRTIAKHLRDLRMAHAMDLLAHSRLPAWEVARAVGHAHYANFRRAFTAAAGCSPRTYRQERHRGLRPAR